MVVKPTNSLCLVYLLYAWHNVLPEEFLNKVHIVVDIPDHHTKISNRRSFLINCVSVNARGTVTHVHNMQC